MAELTRYRIGVPEDWYELPLDESEAVALAESFSVAQETADRLVTASLGARNYVRTRPNPQRHAWGLIRNPSSGRVDAVLTLGFYRVEAGAVAAYAERVRGLPTAVGGVELIRQVVEETVLPDGPAAVVTDFALDNAVEGREASALERATVFYVPGQHAAGFEFSLVTHDLALFTDIGNYLLDLVSNVAIESAEAPA
ncbi:hypothetical protein BH09ACT5_BH09ACT5_16330 [soil metagenome]